MLLRLYTLGIRAFTLGVRVASLRSVKARQWLRGRHGWRQAIASRSLDGPVWFHCSSAGEFEQARPVIELLRKRLPGKQVLLTFYSPSGYALRKDYPHADHVAYLPADTPRNMRDWLDAVQPSLVVFTKYDFWFNLMQLLHERNIPMLAISVHLPARHWLFRWPGRSLLPRLGQFDRIFAQDGGTVERLRDYGISGAEAIGDTRVDRVLANAREDFRVEALEAFSAGSFVVVAGSLWPKDAKLLLPCARDRQDIRWVVAPHETGGTMLKEWKKAFGDRLYHWKDRNESPALGEHHRVVYVDFVGILSKLYRYGNAAYVGGGFTTGIHNILEPAAYGIPVLFGPKHQRFREAAGLLATGQGREVSDRASLCDQLQRIQEEDEQAVKKTSRAYLEQQRGASEKIVEWMAQRLA